MISKDFLNYYFEALAFVFVCFFSNEALAIRDCGSTTGQLHEITASV